ncbi:MAG: Gfo/Idh/MocA family oxidoreductase [Bacteroidales bacterium]|nr:Gfo/Idh/MocA family oxidoreductase [Bacteroidales bacterium]
MKDGKKGRTRRDFIKTGLTGLAFTIAAPSIVPSSVLGKNAPSNRINIGQIGFGRIARSHDLPECMRHDDVQVMAVCDVDSDRMKDGKAYIENWYKENKGQRSPVNVKMYEHYRDLVHDPEIDAVIVSTPDHWHVQPAIEAALAGKDVYVQKPLSLTVEEGRVLSNIIHRTGRILQVGSQQRSLDPWPQFHRACELVRNGRIGKVKEVYVGFGADPQGDEEPPMEVPSNLNYDMWLGSTPEVYYTEKRVHPQDGYGRPGWLRVEQFGAGMITGWGAHHVDTAHWGMGTEYSCPVEVEADATFPRKGIWDVHMGFRVTNKYANGVVMDISNMNDQGVKWVGEDGWISVKRGPAQVTASDPSSGDQGKSLFASDPKILESEIGPNETHLYRSDMEHHRNWLDSIKSRRQPVAPVEIGHRSCSACLISHIGMHLRRKLQFDPQKERFLNDDEANKLLARPQRYPYGIDYLDLASAKSAKESEKYPFMGPGK